MTRGASGDVDKARMEYRPTVIVFGCGTVGLALAAAFASQDFVVQGIDTSLERIDALNAGRAGAPDADLADAIEAARAAGRLSFRRAFERPAGACAFVVAVPTPVDGRHFDDAPLNQAVVTIGSVVRHGELLVVRSTVPVGTTRRLAASVHDRGRAVLVAACPDRSVAGRSFLDQFTVPTVVGGLDVASAAAAAALFAPLGAVHDVGAPEAAEALKLFCNVQRDIGFAVANQFALVCDRLGLDFNAIRHAAGDRYPRFSVPRPGPVGGPCLTKDAYLLATSVGGADDLVSLALAARVVNASLLDHVLAAVMAHLGTAAAVHPVVTVLGLAFKGEPQLADARDGFGAAIMCKLRERLPHGEVRGCDPSASSDPDATFVDWGVSGADVVLLANDHPLLRQLDLPRAAAVMRPGGLIYDACGGWNAGPLVLPNGVTFRALGQGGAAARSESGSSSAGTPPAAAIAANRSA